MAKQQKFIKARHFKRGDIQTFKESHWRVVDKKVWLEIAAKTEVPLPQEVADDIERRSQGQEVKRGRPAKTNAL